MARAKKRRGRAAPSKALAMAWRDAHADLFRLGSGWTPPATVQVRRTVKGYTLVAVFRDDHQRPVRLTTRIAWVRGEDRLAVTDEQLSVSFRVSGRARSARPASPPATPDSGAGA